MQHDIKLYQIGKDITAQDLGGKCALIYSSQDHSGSPTLAEDITSIENLSELCAKVGRITSSGESGNQQNESNSNDPKSSRNLRYQSHQMKLKQTINSQHSYISVLGDSETQVTESSNCMQSSPVLEQFDNDFWNFVEHKDAKEIADDVPCELEGETDDFVVVDDEMLMQSLTSLVIENLKRIPNAKGLDEKMISNMLESTCKKLEKPSLIAKTWELGTNLYSWCNWGSMAMHLYKDPVMAKMVISWAWKASCWAMVLIL
jgi:hypothetical protein